MADETRHEVPGTGATTDGEDAPEVAKAKARLDEWAAGIRKTAAKERRAEAHGVAERIEAQFDVWNEELRRLKARTRQAGIEAQGRQLDELDEDLRNRVARLKQAGKQEWEQARRDVEDAVDALKARIHRHAK